MIYVWVYFLDDSWESWLAEMPPNVLQMPNIDKDLKHSRNFIINEDCEVMTAQYNCTTNVIKDLDHLGRLMAE